MDVRMKMRECQNQKHKDEPCLQCCGNNPSTSEVKHMSSQGPTLIRWVKPGPNQIKLNIDGSNSYTI